MHEHCRLTIATGLLVLPTLLMNGGQQAMNL